MAITYHSRWRGESEFSWAERSTSENLENAFNVFVGELFEMFNVWNPSPSPKDLDRWGLLKLDLSLLCGQVCEACGVVENLDADSESNG